MRLNGLLCALGMLSCNLFAASFDTTPVQVNVPANGAAVPQFTKLELQVNLVGAPTAAPDVYNPAKLDLSATFTKPDGVTTVKVNGFFDGTNWLIRFAPDTLTDATHLWSYTVTVTDPSGSATSPRYTFQCSASGLPGFAQLNGHFIHFSGTQLGYFAIGHNNGWQDNVEQPSLAQMASSGENLLSFWIGQPWGTTPNPRAPLENATAGLSNYDQTACTYIDGVVARAEAANVYLLPTIWEHDQLCNGLGGPTGWPARWDNNAYNTITDPTGFYQTSNGASDTLQWTYQKNYYRYLIARWGYSRAIAGWVGVCEIDGTNGYVNNPTQATAWIGSVKSYFASLDKFRTSPYPFTVTKTDGSSDAATWTNNCDLRAMDSYNSSNNNTAVANTIATQTASMWGKGQPCFDGEFGGDLSKGATQPTHLHNGIWAGTTSGAALVPLVWCDGGNFPMITSNSNMQQQLTILSQFMGNLSYLGKSTLGKATLSLSSSSTRGWGMKTADHGFGWVQNYVSSSISSSWTVTVQSVNAGTYTVEFYDVWSSGSTPILSTKVTVSNSGPTKNQLKAAFPNLSRADIAFKFYPYGAQAQSRELALIEIDAPETSK